MSNWQINREHPTADIWMTIYKDLIKVKAEGALTGTAEIPLDVRRDFDAYNIESFATHYEVNCGTKTFNTTMCVIVPGASITIRLPEGTEDEIETMLRDRDAKAAIYQAIANMTASTTTVNDVEILVTGDIFKANMSGHLWFMRNADPMEQMHETVMEQLMQAKFSKTIEDIEAAKAIA